jgi:hypothetical protein
MFDTAELTPTSAKRGLRWRDTSLTFIWLRAGGPIAAAHTIADKLKVISECGRDDRVLAVRQKSYPTRQEVMVIDDFSPVRDALQGNSTRG